MIANVISAMMVVGGISIFVGEFWYHDWSKGKKK